MKQEDNHFADADPKGRYPANVMHDGSDVVRDIFPNTKTTYVSKHHANNRTTESLGDLGHPGNQGFMMRVLHQDTSIVLRHQQRRETED